MPIAESQGGLDQFDAHVLLERHGAEAENRNARSKSVNTTFNEVHSWRLLTSLA
ncbi:MAG: hypothetical protein WB774_21380 [Xanthobacteraceae bacterium]|jgi:hypothetical protein